MEYRIKKIKNANFIERCDGKKYFRDGKYYKYVNKKPLKCIDAKRILLELNGIILPKKLNYNLTFPFLIDFS